jgi:cation:H+ antiporter
VGTTVAAFATSSPEFAVAVASAASQMPQIALGDALGSSIVNVALILGIVLVISPVQSPRSSVKRDFPVALSVPVVTAILCLDGKLSRVDGVLLLGLFLAWFFAVLREARRQRRTTECVEVVPLWPAAGYGVIGLVLLFGAGQFIVSGARGIAASIGISEFVIGATIVAVGTSVPELATSVIAKWRGHDEVGLGTVLGSNIFNGLWIVPVAAIIYPIDIQWSEVATALIFGVLAMILAFPPPAGLIGRSRGVILLLLYCAYVAALLVW